MDKVTKILYRLDGTAMVFCSSTKTEDQLYKMVDEDFCGNPYFAGWDKTDDGYELDFDASLCYSYEELEHMWKSKEEYVRAIVSDIKGSFGVRVQKKTELVENCPRKRWDE